MQNDKRLIDANALLKEFEKRQEQQTNKYCDCFLNDAQELSTSWWCVEDEVIAAPTIDAVEVVHGWWKEHYFSHRVDTYGNPDIGMECSVCNFRWYSVHDAKSYFFYCPNCGAKMDGGATDG